MQFSAVNLVKQYLLATTTIVFHKSFWTSTSSSSVSLVGVIIQKSWCSPLKQSTSPSQTATTPSNWKNLNLPPTATSKASSYILFCYWVWKYTHWVLRHFLRGCDVFLSSSGRCFSCRQICSKARLDWLHHGSMQFIETSYRLHRLRISPLNRDVELWEIFPESIMF